MITSEGHHTLHSLVPVYAALNKIQKLSVDGFRSGGISSFIDIRIEAENGMAELIMIEKDLADAKGRRRRKYDFNR